MDSGVSRLFLVQTLQMPRQLVLRLSMHYYTWACSFI